MTRHSPPHSPLCPLLVFFHRFFFSGATRSGSLDPTLYHAFRVVSAFFFCVSVCLTYTEIIFKVAQILVLQHSYPLVFYSQDYSSISACHLSQQNQWPRLLRFVASLSLLPKLVANGALLIKCQLNVSPFSHFSPT